jgi:protein-S-isoprenylcysteine O-methyltransferase Ste14
MDTTASDRDRPQVVALPPLVYVGFLVLGFLADLIWPTSIAPLSIRLVLGGLLFAAGLALGAWALARFARAGTPVEVYRPATALVTEGPYRLSRNPIYLGMTLGYAGLAVMGNSLWALVLLIPTLAVIRYGVIAREEEYLERKFGEAYRRYRSAVRRWL